MGLPIKNLDDRMIWRREYPPSKQDPARGFESDILSSPELSRPNTQWWEVGEGGKMLQDRLECTLGRPGLTDFADVGRAGLPLAAHPAVPRFLSSQD